MATKSLSEILHGETRFGRLTVIGEAPMHGKYRKALCLCDCGNEREVFTFSLTGGKTLSCGCFHHQQQVGIAGEIGRANRRHGESVELTPEYMAWRAMRQRCNNAGHEAYPDYGGRGIKVCDRWDSFETFLEDMGRKPNPSLSLDRIDNDKGYEPSNCRWATDSEQNSNRRNVRRSASA